jgi:hypothetical protein
MEESVTVRIGGQDYIIPTRPLVLRELQMVYPLLLEMGRVSDIFEQAGCAGRVIEIVAPDVTAEHILDSATYDELVPIITASRAVFQAAGFTKGEAPAPEIPAQESSTETSND